MIASAYTYWKHHFAMLETSSATKAEFLRKLPVSVLDAATAFVERCNEGGLEPVKRSGQPLGGDAGTDEGAELVKDAPATLIIRLPTPVSYGGATVDQLSLAEPKAGQVWTAMAALGEAAARADVRRFRMVLVSRVSGVSFNAVEQMPISIINASGAYSARPDRFERLIYARPVGGRRLHGSPSRWNDGAHPRRILEFTNE